MARWIRVGGLRSRSRLVDAPKMADLVDRVMVFVNPGRKVVWQEAVPERDLKERSYGPARRC